jgi:hypothetical protein
MEIARSTLGGYLRNWNGWTFTTDELLKVLQFKDSERDAAYRDVCALQEANRRQQELIAINEEALRSAQVAGVGAERECGEILALTSTFSAGLHDVAVLRDQVASLSDELLKADATLREQMSEREAAIIAERRSESLRRERQRQDLKDVVAEMARKAERPAALGQASEDARQILERELDSLRRANALVAAENAAVAEVTIDRDKWRDSYLGADAEIGIIRRQLRNEETLRGDAERALAELRQEAEPMRIPAARLPGLEATCSSFSRGSRCPAPRCGTGRLTAGMRR